MSTTESKRERSRFQPTGCWIRPEKRAAIYHRDGWACVYCGQGVADSKEVPIVLTLDHLIARSAGGSNHVSNLVTACRSCNCSRGSKEWKEFAGSLLGRVEAQVVKPINLMVG